jgi:hypothetical protein
MSIIGFLLHLHARNLKRRLQAHNKANPASDPDALRKSNERLIEDSRRRMNEMLQPQQSTSPFRTNDS